MTFEKDIIKLQRIWNDCTIEDSERQDCSTEIFERLHSYMMDFQWTKDWPEFTQRNYAAIRVGYQAMEILMLKVLAEDPLVETRREIFEWYDTIKNHYLESAKYFSDFKEKMEEERPYDITTVEICQAKQIFWKEFEQPGCEKRWKKNNEDSEKENDKRSEINEKLQTEQEKPQLKNITKDNENLFDDEDEDEEASGDTNPEDAKFYKTFKANFSKVEEIGGISSDFRSIINGKFTDYHGTKVIPIGSRVYDIYNSPKAQNMEKLFTIGFQKHDEYVKKVVKEFSDYVNQTYGKVEKAGNLFLSQLEGFRRKARSHSHDPRHGY